MKAIILAAERGIRRFSSSESYPRALLEDPEGRCVMDWILAALDSVAIKDVTLVGGYHIEKLVAQYPGLNYCFNDKWQNTGTLASFMCAEKIWRDSECVVINARYIFHPEAVANLLAKDGEIVVAVGSHEDRPDPSTFAGIVKFGRGGSRDLVSMLRTQDSSGVVLGELHEFLWATHENGTLPIEYGHLAASWAKVESRASLAHFVMGSKGKTLERLRRVIKSGEILDQVRFTVREWGHRSENFLDLVQQQFPDQRIIVRSSAVAEDSFANSLAGHFDSVLDIWSGDREAVAKAIDQVVNCFAEKGSGSEADEIFVQSMVTDLRISGVAFTRDLETGGPYVTVNYDDRSGLSHTVASGVGSFLPIAIVFQQHLELLPAVLKPLGTAIPELIDVTGSDGLDIEFAIDNSGRLFIFQVRPLTVSGIMNEYDERDVVRELETASTFVVHNANRHPLLCGSSSLLADMTDWNPAEIIGTHPRPLALSLYRYLVTDAVWAESRYACGYRDVRGLPLLRVIGGKPYVDIRTDFNSFIPAALPKDIATKLIDTFVSTLRDDPQLQDKIEFDVIPTCLDFDFQRFEKNLAEKGLIAGEIDAYRSALRDLTEEIITGGRTPHEQLRAQLNLMRERRSAILSSEVEDHVSICRLVEALLRDCVQFGTLAFASAARHGFIATAFLRSIVTRGCLSNDNLHEMLATLPTISSRFATAVTDVAASQLSREALLQEYGHLRPGTYEICVPSYAEAPDHYIGSGRTANEAHKRTLHQDDQDFHDALAGIENKIAELIAETGFTFDSKILIDFITRSIPFREWAKFEFTQNLSAALSLLRKLSEKLGLTVDEISFVPVEHFLRAGTEGTDELWINEIRRQSELYRKRYNITSTIRLPPVVAEPRDIWGFVDRKAKPNFITAKSVTAPLKFVDLDPPDDFRGCIAAIERADPGYDWLMTKGIAGLVTKYGGVASHMSIRCAEFGLPAAIGCGDVLFDSLKRAAVVHIDCAAQRIERVH